MNKTERLLYQKHSLTDEERNQCLKLINCGLSTHEIAEIMHISKSTVCYIRQAHTACLSQDWSTLQRLSTCIRPTVDWAMKLTGADKAFLETFGNPKPAEKEPEQVAPTTALPDTILTREDVTAMYATMQDIRSLLIEIRDVLNEIK
jgi:hypothetical protein